MLACAGIKVEDIVSLNHALLKDKVEEGQTILLPSGKLSTRDKEILAGVKSKGYRAYPVRKGEKIEDITEKRKIAMADVEALNEGVKLGRLKGACGSHAQPTPHPPTKTHQALQLTYPASSHHQPTPLRPFLSCRRLRLQLPVHPPSSLPLSLPLSPSLPSPPPPPYLSLCFCVRREPGDQASRGKVHRA